MEEGIFENENYKYISEYVEKKIPILRKNKDFEEKYTRITDVIEELESTLKDYQKEELNEIIDLFYQTEEYYFAFAYSLGVKYGEELKKL